MAIVVEIARFAFGPIDSAAKWPEPNVPAMDFGQEWLGHTDCLAVPFEVVRRAAAAVVAVAVVVGVALVAAIHTVADPE